MNATRPFRSAYGSKTALAARMVCIRENGARASKKTFDSRNGKLAFLALGAIGFVPVKAVRMQSHESTEDMQLYRPMSKRQSSSKLNLFEAAVQIRAR